MTNKEIKYQRGEHPNSLSNLKPGISKGRPRGYDSCDKKRRHITVTATGWEGVKLIAEQYNCKSVSEFLEKLGRGEIALSA